MILLARSGLGTSQQRVLLDRKIEEPSLPTNAVLVSASGKGDGTARFNCIFCGKQNHENSECFLAKKMSYNDRKSIIMKNRACFKCLKLKHTARFCRNKGLTCGFCDDKSHHTLLCPQKEGSVPEKAEPANNASVVSSTLSNRSAEVSNVYLQMVILTMCHNKRQLVLRGLLDSGSENSYLTMRAVEKLKLKPISQQTMAHGLFGGRVTSPRKHSLYDVEIGSLKSDFSCKIPVLSENKICGTLPKVRNPLVMSELKDKCIEVPDFDYSHNDIDLLLGADTIGLILTGRNITLDCGLMAIETKLGYTLMGKIKAEYKETEVMCRDVRPERQFSHPVVSMLNAQSSTFNVKELWE